MIVESDGIVKVSDNTFVVVLPNVNYKSDLENNDDKVYGIIKNRRNIRRKDIEIELNLSKSTVNLILKKLLSEGKIAQEGRARNTKYYVKYKI